MNICMDMDDTTFHVITDDYRTLNVKNFGTPLLEVLTKQMEAVVEREVFGAFLRRRAALLLDLAPLMAASHCPLTRYRRPNSQAHEKRVFSPGRKDFGHQCWRDVSGLNRTAANSFSHNRMTR
jgi:hypothetical protein